MRAEESISLLYQSWLGHPSWRIRIWIRAVVQLTTFFIVRTDSVESAFAQPTEEEAEELREDFIRHKYNEGAQQDEPSCSEYHKGDHVESSIAIILGVRIRELDNVDDILVSEACSEIVQLVLPNQ